MLRWAASHPDRFASATLINTGVLPGYRWHYLARIWRTPILGELFQATATRPAFRPAAAPRQPAAAAQGLRRPHVRRHGPRHQHAILALYRATDDPGGEPAGCCRPRCAPDRPALVV